MRPERHSETALSQSGPRLFRAPGRVNLIGEHTDYNEGYVFPQAIDRYVYVEALPWAEPVIEVWTEELSASARFDLQSAPVGNWSDYARGVSALLRARGLLRHGGALRIRSTLPLGGGLSSSAALEVGVALALLGLNGKQLPPMELARLCQRAEHEYPKMRCGIMDQFIVTHAQEGAALMLDCRSLEHRRVRLPDGNIRLVVANTMVKHELAASAYNQRRRECEEAARLLGVSSLRDVTPGEFHAKSRLLPEPVRSRARHVVEENARVLFFAQALERGDWREVGELMAESHDSLKNLYQVSCPELDFMVDAARELGSLGSRMTGGGFGGCTIHFVEAGQAEGFAAELATRYRRHFGIRAQIFPCLAAGAASEVIASVKAD
jgi:galactokinase